MLKGQMRDEGSVLHCLDSEAWKKETWMSCFQHLLLCFKINSHKTKQNTKKTPIYFKGSQTLVPHFVRQPQGCILHSFCASAWATYRLCWRDLSPSSLHHSALSSTGSSRGSRGLKVIPTSRAAYCRVARVLLKHFRTSVQTC